MCSETFAKRSPFVIPTKVGIHNKFKMLVLDVIGDWIPVCTGMTIQTIYGKTQRAHSVVRSRKYATFAILKGLEKFWLVFSF